MSTNSGWSETEPQGTPKTWRDVMLIASFVLGGFFWNKFRALVVRTAKVETASAA